MNGTKVDAGLGCMSSLLPAMWVVQEGSKYQSPIAAVSMLLFPDMWAVQQGRKEHMRQEEHLLNLFCCPWEQIKMDHTGGVAERWARLLNLYHPLIAAYFSGQSWLCWPARVQLKLVDIKGEPM